MIIQQQFTTKGCFDHAQLNPKLFEKEEMECFQNFIQSETMFVSLHVLKGLKLLSCKLKHSSVVDDPLI